MNTVAIVVKPHGEKVRQVLDVVTAYLEEQGKEILIDERTAQVTDKYQPSTGAHIKENADLVVVLGGDGTLISAVRILGKKDTPILGVNLGRLGFLTEHRDDEVVAALEQVFKGNYSLERRMKLHSHIYDNGISSFEMDCLNDICINKSDVARIIEIEVYIDDKFVNTYRADGLIFSTPTGSTAYNLAAGGPIVQPGLESIIITPICPHSLTNRPIVVSNDSKIYVKVLNEDEKVSITYDGQFSMNLDANKKVYIQKSETFTNLVIPSNKNYYMLLHEKLGWGK